MPNEFFIKFAVMTQEHNKKTAVGLTDEEIIEGLRNRDPQITHDYFYGICRIAYHQKLKNSSNSRTHNKLIKSSKT